MNIEMLIKLVKSYLFDLNEVLFSIIYILNIYIVTSSFTPVLSYHYLLHRVCRSIILRRCCMQWCQ